MSEMRVIIIITREFLMLKVKIISISFILIIAVILGFIYLQPAKNTVNNIPSVDYADDPVPDFDQYERVEDKKQAFFDYLTPVIASQNQYIASVRSLIQEYQEMHASGKSYTEAQQEELDWLLEEYRVSSNDDLAPRFTELLRKVDLIPAELVLVQTANESAWGTSRFARKGYNFFGLWCFTKGCGFVPSERNEGAKHEVAKFDDLTEAMYSYMRNLNSHPAYKELRAIRLQHRKANKEVTAYALAGGLSKYSERGHEYIEELRQMLRVNKQYIASPTI
jgi:Bax protein